MKTTNGPDKTILVTDAGRSCSIAIIRSLGRAGYNVIAADSTGKSIGFRSRFSNEQMVYPPPDAASAEFADFLLTYVKNRKIDLIIPVTDLVIQAIISKRESFEKFSQLALPPNELLATVTDKSKTLEMAENLGIPVPKTVIVSNSSEAMQSADEFSWPVVLKPIASAKTNTDNNVESFSVSYASSPESLRNLMKNYEHKCKVLMQSYHQGSGTGVELLMHKGEPIAVFQHKRLREIPISGGASSFRESVVLDAELYSYSLAILKKLQWTGLAMVEFKVIGTQAVLMEINGRVWGSLPLAVASGVDFPLLLAKLYFDGRDSIPNYTKNSYKVGLRCRDVQRDLMWIVNVILQRQKYPFLAMPKRLEAIKAIAGFFNPWNKFDLFAIDDPKPAFAEIPQIINKFKIKVNQP